MPTIYSVQAPDGTIYDIEGPDDATDEQVAAFAAQQFGGVEPVTTAEIPSASEPPSQPLRVDVNALPEAQRRPDTMAALRGFGDTMLLNYADEIGSAIEAGAISGPEYDQLMAENAALRAADDPNARATGEVLGILGGMLVPAGIAGRVAGIPRQMLVGAGTGAAMNAISGSGANGPDNRTDTLGEDALIGAVVGSAAAPVAALARRVVQATPLPLGRRINGAIDQTAADDAIRASGLDYAALRARAADFQRATGRGARLSDILTPDEAQRFTVPVSRSRDARARVLAMQEADLTSLPSELSSQASAGGAAIGPERAKAIRKADDRLNYGAVENTTFPIVGVDRAVLETEILPYVTLPKATRDKISERFEQNALTGGDLVTIRRALDRFNKERTNSGRAYEDIVAELDAIIGNVAPALNQARAVSAANRAFTEGTEVGRQAGTPGTRSGEVVDTIANLRPAQAPGVAPGTRSALIDRAAGNPRESYALARELQTNPAFQDQLRAALPAQEADDLIAFATAQRQAIDSLGAMARIPPEKMDSILNNVEGMTDAIIGLGFGAGGAFKASMANSLIARLGVGRGAANRLAEDLLEPGRRDRAIELLERAGLPRNGVRELVQGAFISTANTLATADRKPPQ
jgi:hypothetical protein